MPILPLHTARLAIRMMTPAEAPVLASYRNDPVVARFQSWDLPFEIHHAAELLADQEALTDLTPGRWVQLAIDRDGRQIGDLAVQLDEASDVATLGYTLAPQWQGHGYAREAVAAIIDAIFAQTTVDRIQATIDPANLASKRVIEPLGFTYVGTTKDADRVRGEWVDEVHFALSRDDHRMRVGRPAGPVAGDDPVVPRRRRSCD